MTSPSARKATDEGTTKNATCLSAAARRARTLSAPPESATAAPDIAGKGLANPIAMIGSFGMALCYSFGLLDEADRLDKAIANVLASGTRTKDIAAPGMNAVGKQDVGDAIVKELEAQS